MREGVYLDCGHRTPQLKPDSLGDALAITRYSAGRIFAVTLGLAVAGTVFGAVAGTLALGTSLVLSQQFDGFTKPLLFVVAATLGAILGAGCAPLAGWLLLRRLPLGRAFGASPSGRLSAASSAGFSQGQSLMVTES